MRDRAPRVHEPAQEPAPAPRPAEPAREHPVLTLQRQAGNQAVVGLLESAPDAEDVLRRNGDPVAAASAPAPPSTPSTPPADPSAASAPAPPPTPAGPTPTAEDNAAIADPGGYLRSIGATWDAARKKYKSGAIGFVPGGDDGKGKRTATGLGMNALIAYRLQSTVVKKKDDASSNSPMEQIVPEVQKKQTEELAAKQKALADSGVKKVLPPPKPLAWNYGAGSGTATSDIDVNLSGDSTEFAVEAFNALFRSGWGGKESGTVFDVNIYARDYLPDSGAGSLAIAGEKEEAAEGPGAGALATGSAAWAERGVSFETTLQEGSETAKKASGSQEIFSLLKTRKDMKAVDWQRFKFEQLAAYGTDTTARDAKQLAFTETEAKYSAREQALAAEIAKLDEKAKTLAAESKKKGETPPTEDSAADKRMKAENALYEQKLKDVARVRATLAVAKEQLLAGVKTVAEVEEVSADLQAALHEAASYANEAYITGAAVVHVVGNLQLLKGSEKLAVGLSGADYLASANEQVGFIFDDLHREATIEGGLLKAGKYISRLGHAGLKAEAIAAKKASGGKPPTPIASPSCAQVEKYGKELMTIKEKIKPADQNAALGRASADGFTLSGMNRDQVKTAILKFQSKVQTLSGKV